MAGGFYCLLTARQSEGGVPTSSVASCKPRSLASPRCCPHLDHCPPELLSAYSKARWQRRRRLLSPLLITLASPSGYFALSFRPRIFYFFALVQLLTFALRAVAAPCHSLSRSVQTRPRTNPPHPRQSLSLLHFRRCYPTTPYLAYLLSCCCTASRRVVDLLLGRSHTVFRPTLVLLCLSCSSPRLALLPSTLRRTRAIGRGSKGFLGSVLCRAGLR